MGGLALLMLLLLVTAFPGSLGAFVPGDLNRNGKIDLKDVRRLAGWVGARWRFSPEQIALGDCYPPARGSHLPGDGEIDQRDLRYALRVAVGLLPQKDLGPIVITAAGSGPFGRYGLGGYKDGPAREALFSDPWDVAIDSLGDVFITEDFGQRIRKLSNTGVVTTIAGTGIAGYRDGLSALAQFNHPKGITLARDGSLYIADSGNHCIRRISPDRQWVETVAGTGEPGYRDGPAHLALFREPSSVEVGPDGSLWVADTGNNRIRKITPLGEVITVAGSGLKGYQDGPALEAKFLGLTGLWLDRKTGEVYIAEIGNNMIRKLRPDGMVVYVSGAGRAGYKDGPLDQAVFSLPFAFDEDLDGGLLIVDWGNGSVRKMKDGVIITLAGTGKPGYQDGYALQAQFNGIMGIAVDRYGDIYCADTDNQRIRKILR